MIFSGKDCKYALNCKSYEDNDPMCITGRVPKTLFTKPKCYSPKKENLITRIFNSMGSLEEVE